MRHENESIDEKDAYSQVESGERVNEGLSTLSIIFGILASLLLLIKSTIWVIYFAIYAFDGKTNDCYAVYGTPEPLALLSIASTDPN